MTRSSLPSPSSFDPAAEELFFTWQREAEAGKRPDFEALCRAHPQHEQALREMRQLVKLAEHMKPPRPSADLHDDASSSDSAPTAELLEQLRSGGARGERYRLLGEVARGGMGAILRVWDEQLRRTLAMKVVLGKEQAPSGDTPNVDPHTLGRFLEEAQITGQLDHPGIVPVHELGLDGAGRVYFTMKLVQGEDLEAVFKHVRAGSGDWNQVRALGVLLRVCEAVAYAHAKRVIHRDLKPANVMVGKFGEVYVMDWGMARVLGEGDPRDSATSPPNDASRFAGHAEPSDSPGVRQPSGPRTREGDVLGTPNYMPPEQADGRLEHIGPHSDVYAIGAMLYQLVTARTPYASAPSSRAVLELVRAGPPTPVHELAPRTPAELIAIVEKAMSRAIDLRYRDTLELGEDLRAYLEGRVVRAYETGTWAQARKWVQRNKPLALSLATALLAVVSGAASFAWIARVAETARKDAVLNSERAERGESEAREQTKRAEAGERLARENAEEAERNALAAQLASEESTRRANDVLSLSAQKDLDDLIAEADELWPAHPEMIPAYEDWLRRARELIDGRPADEPNGIKKRPGLAEHKAKLAELRREARPPTEEELRAERQLHPRFAELEEKRTELEWRSRMLGEKEWPSESLVESELARESLPTDADGLTAVAWPLVDPAKRIFGQETRALLLARRALAAATGGQRASARDTIAWSLFKRGRLEEALAESRRAVSEPGGASLGASAWALDKSVNLWRGDQLVKRRSEQGVLAADVSALTALVNERRTYELDDLEQGWWDRQLARLVADLEAVCDADSGVMNNVLAEPFGWGVARRYQFARSIGERSVEGPQAQRLWAEAIAAIKASPKYSGLEIVPQIGLLPIGADPQSQLWEFAHLQTGDPAVRGADGALQLDESTGLVFVLIPGGKFWMGAQRTDSAGRNYDPQAQLDEGPVREVELSPYFLSKYELTQGQWARMSASNPSMYKARESFATSLLHPVEHVNWRMSVELLGRLGLSLPSEAQWECGTRGGSCAAWWTGQEPDSVRGKLNLADLSYVEAGGSAANTAEMPDIRDGSSVHSEIGRYAPNGFGLHEVAGNLSEWCLDAFDPAAYGKVGLKDPCWDGPSSSSRVTRGGSFEAGASFARSAYRHYYPPDIRGQSLGVRPARALKSSSLQQHPPK